MTTSPTAQEYRVATGQDRLHLITATIVAFYAGVLTIVFRRTHAALLEQLRMTSLIASSEERAVDGYRTRIVYGRSLITAGDAAGSPSTIATCGSPKWRAS